MKKTFFILMTILALSLLSCNKEQEKEAGAPVISISATLSEALTKVTFTPDTDGQGHTILTLTWAEGDQIRVYDHADHSLYQDFTLDPASVGSKTGTFMGTAIVAASYDVEVVNPSLNYSSQTQPSDGSTGNIKYLASAENLPDYTSVVFSDVSSVLYLRTKLLSTEVAAAVESVDIIASESIFYDNGQNDGKTLTVTLDAKGDAEGDSILNFFATLPVGSKAIPAGTSMIFRLNAPGTSHTVYSRYIKLANGLSLMAGKLNQIDINASHADQWAGASDNGGASAPYLIADKYQMQAMHSLVEAGSKKYFRLVSDVDMDGEAWTPLNSGGTDYVNLDGNGFTLSNFTVTGTTNPTGLFSKLNGQVYDLTIDGAAVTSTTGALGVLAGNLGDGGTEAASVENVTLTNCTVGDSGANLRVSGILAGNIKKAGTVVKNVTISGSTNTSPKTGVSNNMYIGGLIGYAQVESSILSCRVSGCSVTGRDIVGGLVGGLGNNNAASLVNCFVDGTAIDAGSRRVGGLVGMVNGGSVSRCGVESDVTVTSASYDVAGLVGIASNAFTLENSYSFASVSGSNQVGGLIGRLYGAGSVSKCYAAGSVSTSGAAKGGLVGSVEAAGTVSKCISWHSSLALQGQTTSGGSGATFTDCYIKADPESGTVSSHAQEAARGWSNVIWDFSKDFPTLTENDLPDDPGEAPEFNIIPYPASIVEGEGSFAVSGAPVYYDNAFSGLGEDVVDAFATRLGVAAGATSGSGEPGGFNFLLDDSLGEEAYTITVTSAKVVVTAATRTGLFYAVQTLKQLMPVAVYGTGAVTAEWTIPAVSIEDAPRFGYRGFVLDVCRHFFTVNEVKKYLDLMALHKMNRLHWVLTQDQGWRIPIPGYPNLITVGAYRETSPVYPGHDRNNGFYTREQLEEIVAYAAERCITVVPEYDIPGHSIASLAAYPELGCTGGPYAVWKTAGTSADVLCLGKDHSFAFPKAVLDEICDIFPSEYIHIGGDEVPSGVKWKTCDDCLAFIGELGLTAEFTADEMGEMGYNKIAVTKATRLQYHFMKAIRSYLATKGRKVITWQEGMNDEYDLDKVDGFDYGGGMVESWTSAVRGRAAANHGIDAIMAPSFACYFDIRQTDTPGEPGDGPINGGGPSNGGKKVTLTNAYEFNPIVSGITAGNEGHVKGVECAMWTEFISTTEQLEYMLLPRMAATSEVGWTPQAKKSFTRFTGTLEARQFDIYDILGYNYRRAYE
ncbi:MAG: beta-N-acetylhexosaminidase [Bacteroidales bacterium]|nr:beta-N-acetylhexosaminidase [Bacteroidales bacterium]